MSSRAKFALAATILGIAGWYAAAGFFLVSSLVNRRSEPQGRIGAEMRPGPRAPDDGYLQVRITRVYPNSRPLDAKPWHADGGDWTFFDCAAGRSGEATFVVGLMSKKEGTDEDFAWGEAILAVADPRAGDAFVQLLASSFHQPPPDGRPGQPPGRLKVHAAVLGTAMSQSGEGFAPVPAGDWTATKWFLEDEGYEAEVFFNYDLRQMRAEFSEKDADYREDLLLLAAVALRDGPLPERTPENDPNLTLAGPRFTDWRPVATGTVGAIALARDNSRVVFSEAFGPETWSVASSPLDRPERSADAARFDHRITELSPLVADATRVLATEMIPKASGKVAIDFRNRLWLVDLRSGTKEELRGPWGESNWSLPGHAVSPDGRFVAVQKWLPKPEGKGAYTAFYLYDFSTLKAVDLTLKGRSLTLCNWKGVGPNLRAIVYSGHAWEKDGPPQRVYAADPVTGLMVDDPTPVEELESAWVRSPDGRRRAQVKDDRDLIVTDIAAGRTRTFAFDRRDRSYLDECGIWWADSRYLFFQFARPALIDTNTMKMNFPMRTEEKTWPEAFTSDFRRVVARGDRGLYVGRVLMP